MGFRVSCEWFSCSVGCFWRELCDTEKKEAPSDRYIIDKWRVDLDGYVDSIGKVTHTKAAIFQNILLIGKGREWTERCYVLIRALTERLILILNLRREEWSRCHRLFNAFHLIRLIADKPRRDRIIALLDGRRASDRHIQHRSIISIKTLLLCLVQSIWNGVHLLCFTTSDRVVCRPLRSNKERFWWEMESGGVYLLYCSGETWWL